LSEDFPALAGFRAGSLVAGYRLEAQVGAGGMAVVFRARDERLGRLVALKILAPALAADSAFRRRFIAESRAAAAVDDPHIIPVYEAGEAGGVLFIAMRFVGGDLRGVLEREGPLAPGRAAGFVSPVASALDAAHRAGLVHRDVKPANILVDAYQDRPDHVYLSDFGVSKGAASSVSLTGTGQFLGTPEYAAPEQIQGRAVDGRADQYALACVTYQLLTGAAPFERDQGMAVLLAHLSEPPPSLSWRRPGLPAEADRVLARGMAKVPEKRYGSCRDFADALREALGLPPYTSRGPAAAPGHPPTEIASHLGFPGSATAGTGTAASPADPSAAETIDAAARGGQADAADVPAAAAIVTRPDDWLNEGIPVLGRGPGTGGGTGPVPPAAPAAAEDSIPATAEAPSHPTGTAGESGGAQSARRPQRRLFVIALACAILAAAGVVSFVLARSLGSPRSPGSPSHSHVATTPGSPTRTETTPTVTAPDPPGSVTAAATSQYTVQVTWADAKTDFTGFNIDNGCPVGYSGCRPGASLTQTTGPVESATFRVTPGSYQCFRVQAFNGAGASSWSGYGCTSTPGLIVSGTQEWTNTSVTVAAGDALGITASGQVNISPTESVGPAGDPSCTPAQEYPGDAFPAPDLPCWSLTARIGNGTPFEVGTSALVTADSGVLYLGINDDSFSGNSGGWTVNIGLGGLPPSP